MDFDEAKENIQPLAQGRNASILQASIKVDCQQELMAQRKELESQIHNYSGDDPLSAWYAYIDWIEQSYPSGGKESGLQAVLAKCLSRLESDERYYQDRRMIKLYIKYIDSHKDPAECYQQLFNAGIGTMVSDFYIAWAYCYDLVDNTRRADEIFRRGISCRAQPLEELQEAHQHFGFAVAQRLMYKDDDSIKEETNRQLQERRLALSSLRGHRRKQLVGSVRTGAAIKNVTPGTIKNDGPSSSQQRSNAQVQVFTDENKTPNVIPTTSNASSSGEIAVASDESKSVVRSIIDAQRDQENLKEPGPWNKPYKKGKLFGKTKVTNELGFEIHEDANNDQKEEEDDHNPCVLPIPITNAGTMFDKRIKLHSNFCGRSRPQVDWIIPVTTEEKPDRNCLPAYNKCKLYPRPNMEFQPEEYKAYVVLKKSNICNNFTKRRDIYWGRGPEYNIRQYPHFAKQSIPQTVAGDAVTFFKPQKLPGLQLPYDDIYNEEEQEERQYEEILAMRIKRNETIIKITDMEETICVSSEKIQRRKSFYPMRKSMAPCANNRGATRKVSIMPECVEEYDEVSHENEKPAPSNRSSTPAIFEAREKIETPKVLSKLQRQPCIMELPTEDEQSKDVQRHLETEQPKNHASIVMPSMFSHLQQQSEPDVEKVQAKCNSQPFQIFQDERFGANPKTVASSNQQFSVSPNGNEEFKFKTPAVPRNGNFLSAGVAKPNKIHFEIFEDNAASNNPKSDSVSESGGYFDADETCSTQTFNIFIKAQSVSTPKPKPEPQRQFGNILKETLPPPPMFEAKEEEQVAGVSSANPDNSEENCPAAVTVFSPQRKQLSTILETSENGTTQSTHTTGATTKSSISSPEYDQESHAHTQHIPTLDTVRERTLEKSDTVEDMLSSMRIAGNQMNASNNELTLPKAKPPPCTPGVIRSERVISKPNAGGCIDFSIFEDTLGKDNNHAGNFSRLAEKEDTATGYAVRPVRFQEDKTETISKVLLAPQQSVKFQEDKTENISAMLLAPPQPVKFQEDKTETISKMLLAPPQPLRYQEDKTETMSRFMLAPPQPSRFEEQAESFPKIPIKDNSIAASKGKDDFFEFFSQSPPKPVRAANANPLENGPMANLRTAGENITPLAMDSKRFCHRNTPDMQKTKLKQALLFENEKVHTEPNTTKSVLRDSFISDFSMVENSQPKAGPSTILKPKSVLRDSFVPDFSLIEDSQPQKKQISERQPIADNSIIPDSQPMHSSFDRMKQQNSLRNTLQSSLMPDFSYIPETQQQTGAGISSNEGQPSGLKNILTDTFMKDFSKIKEPPPIPKDVKEMTMLQPSKNNSTLKFLEESLNQKSNDTMSKASSPNNTLQLTLSGSRTSKRSSLTPNPVNKSTGFKKHSEGERFFELNAETEMFGTNISMIRNSTWLPNHGPVAPTCKQPPHIQEKSIHIKHEISSTSALSLSSSTNRAQTIVATHNPSPELPKPKLSFLEKSDHPLLSASHFSIDVSQSELDAINAQKQTSTLYSRQTTMGSQILDGDNADDFDMSIYYKHTPKTPKAQVHVWDDDGDEAFKTPANNRYTHAETDLNQTRQILEHFRVDPEVNPFSVDLINAFLEHIQFANYIEGLPHCMLVGRIHCLKANTSVKVNSISFEVTKLIGEGAYGAVFCGKETISGKNVALKQEKPPNFWEYYICLEIQDRIRIDDMLPAFMSVDYALISNNCSILISQFSQYGSLITVCNKIKKHTMKNVDEYVVMLMACELLEIMDHLHAVGIIHADIKADNFLLMKRLEYPLKNRCLQLIDFGVSIDMKMFNQNQKFSYVHTDNSFKCVEMREQRPWTYQLDLYGLAGVLHVLLFGKYMDIVKKPSGIWMQKTHVPRYFNRTLWENIFKTLLNIRDCNSMPNLQNLRALLKEEIEEKEKYVVKMVNEFNKALNM